MTKTQQTRRDNFALLLKRFAPHMCQEKDFRPHEQVERWALVDELYGDIPPSHCGHFVRLFSSRSAALAHVNAPRPLLSPGAKIKYVALADLSKGTVETLKLAKAVTKTGAASSLAA